MVMFVQTVQIITTSTSCVLALECKDGYYLDGTTCTEYVGPSKSFVLNCTAKGSAFDLDYQIKKNACKQCLDFCQNCAVSFICTSFITRYYQKPDGSCQQYCIFCLQCIGYFRYNQIIIIIEGQNNVLNFKEVVTFVIPLNVLLVLLYIMLLLENSVDNAHLLVLLVMILQELLRWAQMDTIFILLFKFLSQMLVQELAVIVYFAKMVTIQMGVIAHIVQPNMHVKKVQLIQEIYNEIQYLQYRIFY